ncbi:MAG: DUF4115 domain-containing protein [Oscillatoriaceae bacterium SKW80]|nr:DUF4115 domain-containing protein [Oscillatoriaceae bacterium SKYG93]MCX8120211.1 DUF4115 domain-containing protein [Oscillatoriaceae bacterium SKW80]MDW8453137.1 DUF4115 domain-containing protein [Oscillatoriaceae cyanobacterium SKYGB_i_bin93]HIK28951.1 helix-turn-helix domain-containing protein [Oscillatoriaceae cyanobacterium M7585_C2015_266]
MNKNKNIAIRNYDQERAEKLPIIGAKLRQVREELEISLEEVAIYTKIRYKLLQALEEGKVEQLPEPVYVQGFIRRYADALGLDGAALAAEYPIENQMRLIKLSWIGLSSLQLRPIHLYAMYVLLVIFAVNGLSYMLNRTATQAHNLGSEHTNPNISVPAETQSKSSQIASSKPISSSTATTTVHSNRTVRVGLTLKAQSWIQIIADGKIQFEGELPEGTQRTWEAKEQLIVRAGNAGGVMMAINDGTAKQMGEPGQVEEVTVKAPSPKS